MISYFIFLLLNNKVSSGWLYTDINAYFLKILIIKKRQLIATLSVFIMAPSLSPGIKIPLLIDAVEVGDTMSIVLQVRIQISMVFICVFGSQQR